MEVDLTSVIKDVRARDLSLWDGRPMMHHHFYGRRHAFLLDAPHSLIEKKYDGTRIVESTLTSSTAKNILPSGLSLVVARARYRIQDVTATDYGL